MQKWMSIFQLSNNFYLFWCHIYKIKNSTYPGLAAFIYTKAAQILATSEANVIEKRNKRSIT